MSEKGRKLRCLLFCALVFIVGFTPSVLGVLYKPAEPTASASALSGGATNLTSLILSDDLTVGDDATIAGDASIAGALTLDGLAVGGAVVYGSATSVVSGTTIAHGVGTTPTVGLLTVESSGGFTTTFPYVLSMDTVSITVGVADGVTLATVYWLAGK